MASDDAPGIWVQAANGVWHRSTEFDGYDHGLACGLTLYANDDVQDVQQDTDTRPDGSTCDACLDELGLRGDGDG